MIKQSIIIFDFKVLADILFEIKEKLNFELYVFEDYKAILNLDFNKYGNYLIVTKSKNNEISRKNFFIINEFPIKISKLIEKLNIELLKQRYNYQSEIILGKYILDLNSRIILKEEKKIKLTEKEIDVIMFLKNSKKSQSIETLQSEVWGHNSILETHTVETHIYRLRKKINNIFDDNQFITSSKEGYKINV